MRFKFYAIKLAVICIVIFILQNIIPIINELFILNSQAYTGLQFWRFLTSIFLHANIGHLIYNIFALALFGSILEKFINKQLIYVFLLSGIFANIISGFFYPASLGASGAIFGILGCLTLIKPLMTIWAFGMPMPMFVAAILWITGDVFGIFLPSNIGHIAHLSGIFFGLILGAFFKFRYRESKNIKRKIKIPEEYILSLENKNINKWGR